MPEPAAGPLTLVLSRQAKPGREAEMEAWLRGVTAVAATFPGHLGAEVHRPVLPDQPEYVVVYRFATPDDLARWNASPERARWLRQAEPLTQGEARLQAFSGLDGWFTLPGRQPVAPPPRWKTAAITAPVIYLLVVALSLVAGPVLAALPLLVRTAATVLVLVPTMTWLIMPPLTRVLRPWLFDGP